MTSMNGHVLVLSQYYAPEPIGTAPYAADLAEWLSHSNDVWVVTNRPYYPSTEVQTGYKHGERDEESLGGVHLSRVAPLIPGDGGALGRLGSEVVFFLRALRRVAKERNPPQYVVTFCPSIFTVLLGDLLKPRGSRHIAVVHDIQSGLAVGLKFRGARLFGRALGLLEGRVLRRASAVVVLSHEMGDQLRARGVTSPIFEVPIWVDTNMIRPMPPRTTGRPTLLYSGNLGRKQGLPILIALAERIQQRRPDVRILIRGNGNQAASIADEVRARKLENVDFAALVPKEQLSEAMGEGDVHLVPQDPNTADYAVPSKIYTIMAAARPAIAVARPSSALWRLAEESKAILCFSPEDVDGLVEGTLSLLEDTARQRTMGEAGRRYVEQCASREKVLGRYAELLFSRP